MIGTELTKLARAQPVPVQVQINSLLDEGATEAEVLALLKRVLADRDAATAAQEAGGGTA